MGSRGTLHTPTCVGCTSSSKSGAPRQRTEDLNSRPNSKPPQKYQHKCLLLHSERNLRCQVQLHNTLAPIPLWCPPFAASSTQCSHKQLPAFWPNQARYHCCTMHHKQDFQELTTLLPKLGVLCKQVGRVRKVNEMKPHFTTLPQKPISDGCIKPSLTLSRKTSRATALNTSEWHWVGGRPKKETLRISSISW